MEPKSSISGLPPTLEPAPLVRGGLARGPRLVRALGLPRVEQSGRLRRFHGVAVLGHLAERIRDTEMR